MYLEKAVQPQMDTNGRGFAGFLAADLRSMIERVRLASWIATNNIKSINSFNFIRSLFPVLMVVHLVLGISLELMVPE